MAEWGQPETDKNQNNSRLTHTSPLLHNAELASALLVGGDLTLQRHLGVQVPQGSLPILARLSGLFL